MGYINSQIDETKNNVFLNNTHLAMKIRQPTAEWKEIHKELSTLPFCHVRQQLVRIIIYFNKFRSDEGCCDACVKYGIKHEPTYTHPIENRSSLKIINYQWHSLYNKLVIRLFTSFF